MHKIRCYNTLYRLMLVYLFKTLSQILFLANINKNIKSKPKKSKHSNSQKCQKKRNSKDIKD